MSDDLVLGIDVGGTDCKVALLERDGRVALREQRPTPRGAEQVVEGLLALATDMVKRAGSRHVAAVGMAVPGLVDEARGVAVFSVNLGWRDVPLRQMLSERLQIPAVVGHDVRTASLAEGLLGAAQGCRDYLFVTLGTGVGASVVLRGEAYTGAHGGGGEFGHISVRPDGPHCACGRMGCIEAISSASAVARHYLAGAGTQEPEDITCKEVAKRAAAGDALAARVWGEAVHALARGLANYITLLDPERVVIGGGMADAGPKLFEPLNEQLGAELQLLPAPPVLPAALGNDAGYLGAALRAWLALGVPAAELRWRGFV